MNYDIITNKYYSKWLGVDDLLMNQKGIYFIKSEEREKCQRGYPSVFDLYIFNNLETMIISYGNKTEEKISALKKRLCTGMETVQICKEVAECFNHNVNRNIKYIFCGSILQENISTTVLQSDDFNSYLEFFVTVHPNFKDVDYLKEYFIDMVQKRYCHGVFYDNKLVSVTDAPHMPYMKNEVQEIGINTIAEYQGMGYAKAVCLSCIKEMIKQNICPQWSTAYGNVASDKLAHSIGFRKFADIITVSF